MIIFDKKKALQTIMAKRNPKDNSMSAPVASELSPKDESGEVDGRHAAAEDMIAAMHEKSPHKLMEAMANFMDMHNSHEAEDTEPEVPEQPDKES